MALTRAHAVRTEIPTGEKILLHLRVKENPAASGRWRRTTATVGYWRDPCGGEWRRVNEKLVFNIDTCYSLAAGGELICAAYVNPFDESGYARLMRVRGYSGSAFLTPGNLVAVAPSTALTPATIAARMRGAAIERLSRLNLDTREMSVAAAMSTGERRELPRELREAYSRAGAAHLLSVSGLHVGIVFVLVNCLLWLLPLVRRGHIAKNVAAVAAIWAYAAMTGLSPSATRAALMFTGAQAALAASVHRSAVNILLATATVMILVEPSNLSDVSFQVSMAAVLAIVLLFRPVYERVRTRRRALDAFVSVFVVGFLATLGTAPLVAHYFGNFPLLTLFVNPPVILCSHVVVLISMLWIILPAEFMQGAAGWLLDCAAGTQNRIVEWTAALPGAAVEVRLSGVQTLIVYFAYLLIFIAMWAWSGKRKPVIQA
jgi:competence protein ComEC